MEITQSKPTISDVARVAGVSKTTVSRVLNKSNSVSQDALKRVNEAISRIGYRPSASAYSLATGRADAFAVLFSEPFDSLYQDPTFARLLRGINDELLETNIAPILFHATSLREQQRVIRLIERGTVDGIIHLSPYYDDGLLAELIRLRLPAVMCGQRPDPRFENVFSYVYADDIVGGRLAGQRVLAQDCHRVAIILGPEDNPANGERFIGYREVLGDRFDPELVWVGDRWDSRVGWQGTQALLAKEPNLDAVLCASDRIARGVMECLNQHGRRVPDDVKVVGFDNHALSERTSPPLTTVEQPFLEQGRRAVRMLNELLAGERPRSEVLEIGLILRESA